MSEIKKQDFFLLRDRNREAYVAMVLAPSDATLDAVVEAWSQAIDKTLDRGKDERTYENALVLLKEMKPEWEIFWGNAIMVDHKKWMRVMERPGKNQM